MADVFVWSMTAEAHSSSIGAFREEIIWRHTEQAAFPVGLIVDMLPLDLKEGDQLRLRGDFVFNGDVFENIASETLLVNINDPVLKEFSIVIPERWAGSITVDGENVTIEFDPSLSIEIQRLTELGVDRSAFQLLTKIEGGKDYVYQTLVDEVDQNKITVAEVKVGGGTGGAKSYVNEANNIVVFDSSSDPCGPDPQDPNWFVYTRIRDRVCIVHYGEVVYGGQVAWSYRFGPSTQEACNRYVNTHCPDGYEN